jgi:transcriptional regulator with XRE-family HTH domain
MLRLARVAAGMTQLDVADELGVGQPTVSVWEAGEQVPDVERFEALEAAVGLEAGTLRASLGLPPVDDGPPLSVRIRDARLAAGLLQADLAARVGVTQATVSDWERGRFAPRLEQLGRIADALGVAAETLLAALGLPNPQAAPQSAATPPGYASLPAEDRAVVDRLVAHLLSVRRQAGRDSS